MKCPVCSFISSDKRDICPKCSVDLRPHKEGLGVKISHPDIPADELRRRYREAGRRKSQAKKSAPRSPKAKASKTKKSSNWLQLLGIGEKKKVKRKVRKKKTAKEVRSAELEAASKELVSFPEQAEPSKDAAPTKPSAASESAAAVAPVAPVDNSEEPPQQSDSADSVDELEPAATPPEEVTLKDKHADSTAAPPTAQQDDDLVPPEAEVEEPIAGVDIKPSEMRLNIPQVAPEVLDLGDTDEDEFEKLLDSMIGDVSFDVEAVAVEKPKKRGSEGAFDLSGLLDEDIEVSFDFGEEDDTAGEGEEEDDEDGDDDDDDEFEIELAAAEEALAEDESSTGIPENVLTHLLEDPEEEEPKANDRPLKQLLDDSLKPPTVTPDEVTPEMITALELSAANEDHLVPTEHEHSDPASESVDETSGDTAETAGLDDDIASYLASIGSDETLSVLVDDSEEETEDEVETYVSSVGDEEMLEVLDVVEESDPEPQQEELVEVLVEADAPEAEADEPEPQDAPQIAQPPEEIAEEVTEEVAVIVEADAPEAEADESEPQDAPPEQPRLEAIPGSVEEYVSLIRSTHSTEEIIDQLVSTLASISEADAHSIRSALYPVHETVDPSHTTQEQPANDVESLPANRNFGPAVAAFSQINELPTISPALWTSASDELYACCASASEDFEMDAGELVSFQPTNSATILFDLASRELSGEAAYDSTAEKLPNSAAAIIQSSELEDEIRKLEEMLGDSTAESLEEAVLAVGTAIGAPSGMSSALVPEVMFIVSDENAKLWKRVLAKLIDVSAVAALAVAVSAMFFGPPNALSSLLSLSDWLSGVNAPFAIVSAAFAAAIWVAYNTSFVFDHGKSLGKATLGLRVASTTDLAISFPQALSRACVEAISLFLLGLPLALGLHGRASKTKVVAEFQQSSDG